MAVGPGLHAARSGTARATTNNRMELTAVIEALRFLAGSYPGSPAVAITDSQYVKQGITDWIRRWEKNGWRTATKKPVKNRDLWQALNALDRSLRPQWRWVRGHAGERYNEECDGLVRDRLRGMTGG